MKRLGKGPFAYVPRVEAWRVERATRAGAPDVRATTFWMRPQSAWDALRWETMSGFEAAAVRGSDAVARKEAASKIAETDLDALVSHIDRIENVETDTPGVYETITDPVKIREFLTDPVFTKAVRDELWDEIQNRSVLTLGEPERLRSLSMSSHGGEASPPASATTTAGSAHAPELGESEPGNSASDTTTVP